MREHSGTAAPAAARQVPSAARDLPRIEPAARSLATLDEGAASVNGDSRHDLLRPDANRTAPVASTRVAPGARRRDQPAERRLDAARDLGCRSRCSSGARSPSPSAAGLSEEKTSPSPSSRRSVAGGSSSRGLAQPDRARREERVLPQRGERRAALDVRPRSPAPAPAGAARGRGTGRRAWPWASRRGRAGWADPRARAGPRSGAG